MFAEKLSVIAVIERNGKIRFCEFERIEAIELALETIVEKVPSVVLIPCCY